ARIPKLGGLVLAAGEEGPAVGADRHHLHAAVVAHLEDEGAAGRIPDGGGAVLAGGPEEPAGRGERNWPDEAVVRDAAQEPGRGHVPQQCGVHRQREDGPAVGAETCGVDRAPVRQRLADGSAGGRLPEMHTPSVLLQPPGRQRKPAVWAEGHGTYSVG